MGVLVDNPHQTHPRREGGTGQKGGTGTRVCCGGAAPVGLLEEETDQFRKGKTGVENQTRNQSRCGAGDAG